MALHFLMGPVGIIFVGLAVLIGTFSLFRSKHHEGVRTRQMAAMIQRLQTEKEEVTALLTEAQQTTLHLSNMIDSFERTFYSDRAEDGSVAEIFKDLKRDLRSDVNKFSRAS